MKAGYGDTLRTIIYTGRPCRILKNPYAVEFNEKRQDEINKMQESGLPAFIKDINPEVFVGSGLNVGLLQLSRKTTQEEEKAGIKLSKREEHLRGPWLSGECAGAIDDIKPAKEVIDEIIALAAQQLNIAGSYVVSKL